MTLRYVLIADGSSDAVLHAVIRWSLRQQAPNLAIGESPTLLRRHRPPGDTYLEALDIWQPDLVVFHRDAEAIDPRVRRAELPQEGRLVPLIPVRMTEAWLLFDEAAIRAAAGRPRGREPLMLPKLSQLEGRADPKELLEGALIEAAGSPSGRALRRLREDLGMLKHRVAENIEDFTPLRALSAFAQWEADLSAALRGLGITVAT